MDQLSAVLLSKTLDGLAMRAAVIAQNIANANSQSYVPQAVNFESALKAASLAGPDAVRNVDVRMERARGHLANGELRLDLELANASHTAVRYAALIDLLNRQMQVTRLAIRGGQT